ILYIFIFHFSYILILSFARWKLINTLKCKYTYGYITKTKRIEFNLKKTHYNDAFVIAGGNSQERVMPVFFEQIRRNNRSLEKFYDAKYIDSRDKKIKTGKELFNGKRKRNRNLNLENLHQFRKNKFLKEEDLLGNRDISISLKILFCIMERNILLRVYKIKAVILSLEN
ncbi:MAG: hypothetical protein ACPLW7_01455, partial [Minisyncoccia bacterium]